MDHEEIEITTRNADIPLVFPLLEEYGAVSQLDRFGSFDRDAFYKAWGATTAFGGAYLVLYRPDGTVQGAAGVLVSPAAFWGWSLATTLFWFVREPWRKGRKPLKILQVAIDEAKRRGCRQFFSGHLAFWNADHMGRLYRALGFAPHETMYLKEI